MAVNPNTYTSPTAGTIKLGTKSLTGSDAINVLTGTASEIDPQSYYKTLSQQQPSTNQTSQSMSNVGAELFAANTTYTSIFDRYKNKPGGIRQIGDEMLKAIHTQPKKPDDPPPPVPPPSAPLVEDFGYMDPGGVGPDSGYTGWDDGPAQSFDVTQGETSETDLNIQVDGRDATLGEIGSNIIGAIGNLGQFAMQGAPTNVIATLARAAWNDLTGNKSLSKPLDILDTINKNLSKGNKTAVVPYPSRPQVTSRVAAARATASRAQAAIDAFAPDSAAAVAAAAAAQNASFDPDVSVGTGTPGDIGNVGMLASGGTVKAKAKKVPSFMDSK